MLPSFNLLLYSSPAYTGLSTSPKRLSEANVIGISILKKRRVGQLAWDRGELCLGGGKCNSPHNILSVGVCGTSCCSVRGYKFKISDLRTTGPKATKQICMFGVYSSVFVYYIVGSIEIRNSL
jgi:hypothetical protein